MMNREFTQRLRDLAKSTAFREVKSKIDAYFTLHDEIDINDPSQALFLIEQLKPFMTKDQNVYAFCRAFENREALRVLGMGAALAAITKSKIYGINDKIKYRVDELIEMKHADVHEIKIYEAYKNEVQGLVLDDFLNKYMNDVDAKYNQFKAYALVDEAIECLSNHPSPEILDRVFMRLESAMSLPASQVPFYLIKALSNDRHLSPIIGRLLAQLAALDPSTQHHTMNQVRYVGNAGIYESVVAPVQFGKDKDLVMLGNRLFNISESDCDEPIEGEVDEAFVNVCRAFAQTQISESGAISVVDDNNNVVEIDENAEGLILTVNKIHHIRLDEKKGWQSELLGMQLHPKIVSLVGLIAENLDKIVSMDNIMSLQSASGSGYSMFFVRQGAGNHMIITDPSTGGVAITKNISVKEAIASAMEAFGADIGKFFGEQPINDSAEQEGQMREIQAQIDAIESSITEIHSKDADTQQNPEVLELLEQLEEERDKLNAEYEQLAGQLEVVTEYAARGLARNKTAMNTRSKRTNEAGDDDNPFSALADLWNKPRGRSWKDDDGVEAIDTALSQILGKEVSVHGLSDAELNDFMAAVEKTGGNPDATDEDTKQALDDLVRQWGLNISSEAKRQSTKTRIHEADDDVVPIRDLARAYGVHVMQADYDELAVKQDGSMSRAEFKKYFGIPDDADENPNYSWNPMSSPGKWRNAGDKGQISQKQKR